MKSQDFRRRMSLVVVVTSCLCVGAQLYADCYYSNYEDCCKHNHITDPGPPYTCRVDSDCEYQVVSSTYADFLYNGSPGKTGFTDSSPAKSGKCQYSTGKCHNGACSYGPPMTFNCNGWIAVGSNC
ncbi:MAG: hypothetical protein K2Q09_05815 [Phycisphaerales bacterium]|nr:hypothetical protein [Phycisphaerales bacterium]